LGERVKTEIAKARKREVREKTRSRFLATLGMTIEKWWMSVE